VEGVVGFSRIVTCKTIPKFLGKRHREDDFIFREPRIGVAYGLAWTEMGGTLLPVEASVFEGDGTLILTGNLGDVMKESARAAISWIESKAREFGLSHAMLKNKTIHIHVPEGAIPKDGPSAGITLVVCVLSALSGITPQVNWAMTGEITLTGRILPIGGVKEKVLAAHRSGMKRVLLPEANRKDMDDVPPEVTNSVEFVFVESISDALKELFPPLLFERAGTSPAGMTRSRSASHAPRVKRSRPMDHSSRKAESTDK
jgi:ATP-dependent Lon protease